MLSSSRTLLGGLLFGALWTTGCGRPPILTTDALPVKRVVVYRNGVAYFERTGHVDRDEVRFKMRQSEVGDFLATLAVMERGGSSVRAAAFPLKEEEELDDDGKPVVPRTEDQKKGLETVVLSLDGKEHDLSVGYVAESPVWRPSYRLVVGQRGEADLQAWGIVENLSGEDWKDVNLSLIAGAPLAFEADLGRPVIPPRPMVTDNGEVIAAVPHGETTLKQQAPAPPPPPPAAAPAAPALQAGEDDSEAPAEADVPRSAASGRGAAPAHGNRAALGGGAMGPGGARRPAKKLAEASIAPAPGMPSPGTMYLSEGPASAQAISQPRNLQSLAAMAAQGGATRYDLPLPVTVPDHSATMVLLLSRKVSGEALFLYSPDGGVPDSSHHPFRVARFTNGAPGTLERGPIAVFEDSAFLGQGMVDPLPAGATATVPFALERAIAVETERKSDELGERIAKIENSQLTIERDTVVKTTYRVRNGGDKPAKMLVKHPRMGGSKLYSPPEGTEDNVGTGSALIPAKVGPNATTELLVDERAPSRRVVDWFSPIAENAIKAFSADPKSPSDLVKKLAAAWTTRNEIVAIMAEHSKLQMESNTLSQSTEETRRNLRAIEKNKTAEALRQKLTARLAEASTKLDDMNRRLVEIAAKESELTVTFKEAIRDIKYVAP
jgi:hypothetical protein